MEQRNFWSRVKFQYPLCFFGFFSSSNNYAVPLLMAIHLINRSQLTRRNQDNHMYAFCYTVASLHTSDPIFLYTEIHRRGSEIPQRSHQRNQSLAAFCNPTLYYTHEQNLQVQPPPRTDRPRKSELIGQHPNYPSE